MIDFNDLRTRVDNLSQDNSPSPEFLVVFGKISNASKEVTSDADKSQLGTLVNDFIGKIPTHILELRRMTSDSNDLAFALAMSTVGECIARIKARNDALENLTKELNEQSELGQKDAKLLTQIKEALDKATKTVTEVKEMISKISDSEANLKARLIALIDAVNNISSIFKPTPSALPSGSAMSSGPRGFSFIAFKPDVMPLPEGGINAGGVGAPQAPTSVNEPTALQKSAQNLLLHIPGEASGMYLLASGAFNDPGTMTLSLLAAMSLVVLIIVRWLAGASTAVMITSVLAFVIWMFAFEVGAFHSMFVKVLPDPWGLIIALFYSTIITLLANAGKIK